MRTTLCLLALLALAGCSNDIEPDEEFVRTPRKVETFEDLAKKAAAAQEYVDAKRAYDAAKSADSAPKD